MSRVVPLRDAAPSQLLVSAAKLRAVLADGGATAAAAGFPDAPLACFRPGDVPFEVTGAVLLADGHTRALAAVLCGADRLHVERVPEDERRDLSLPTYEACVGWCRDAGVADPTDLVGRVVTQERFEREWVARCRRVTDGDADG